VLGSSRSKASPTREAALVARAPLDQLVLLAPQAQLGGRKAAGRIQQLEATTGYNLAGTDLERSTAASSLATGTADYSRIVHYTSS
jgi:hypothetical protein